MQNSATQNTNRTSAEGHVAHPPPEVIPSSYFRWSPWLSRALGAALLAPGLPIIGVSILAIRLTSRGPAVYRQVRVGRRGKQFTMYKLRTMREDAEAMTGPVWAQPNDERVTRVGRVLRWLHLDEFPQLLNVAKGEMSLVGPRPERPEFVHKLVKQVPGYTSRLEVLPGVTGLSQINLPPDTSIKNVREKLVLDVEYIERASFSLDARICLCTFFRLCGRLCGLHGFVPPRLFGLDYKSALASNGRPARPQPATACSAGGNGDGPPQAKRPAPPDDTDIGQSQSNANLTASLREGIDGHARPAPVVAPRNRDSDGNGDPQEKQRPRKSPHPK